MTALSKNLPPIKIADKEDMIRAFGQILAASGVNYDPDITPEKLRQMMLDEGIRSEDDFLSSELMWMRYPEDYHGEYDRKTIPVSTSGACKMKP